MEPSCVTAQERSPAQMAAALLAPDTFPGNRQLPVGLPKALLGFITSPQQDTFLVPRRAQVELPDALTAVADAT
jgi:hypothetical protein